MRSDEKLGETILGDVRVLELVDEEIPIALVILVLNLSVLFQEVVVRTSRSSKSRAF